MNRKLFVFSAAIALLAAVLVASVDVARADNLYGSIHGNVTDATGAAVPDAVVTATNKATNASQQTKTQQDGSYAFLQLAIGDYSVKVEKTGFQAFAAAGVHLDVGTDYVQNVSLVIGAVSTEMTVKADQVQVETTNTQLGTVIDSNQIVNLPLLGRNWLQLQQLEPGVEGASDRFGTGQAGGNFSTNGTQTQMGSFLVDGTDTNDVVLNTQTFNLNPDAIAEFREVTSTISPEYARASGAIVNAVTKSGTNSFHGDAFEFYRDTFLDSSDFTSSTHTASPYHQNLFGGTIGGPVVKNHTYFFFAYQGTRVAGPEAGINSKNVPVFTEAERGGAFGAGAFAASANVSPFPLWGDPCPPTGAKCPAGTAYSTLFTSGNVPTQDFDTVSATLLSKYVPHPNAQLSSSDPALDSYSFNPTTAQKHDQYMVRIDQNLGSKDRLWGTWIQEAVPTTETIPFPGTGANIPGFGEVDNEHFKFLTLSYTHIINDNMVNEVRGGYNRFNFAAVFPQTATLPSSVGFAISPQDTAGAGIPVVNIAGLFDLGFSNDAPQPRIDQTYEAVDNLTWTIGRHTLKLGFDMRRWQVWNPFLFQNNGFYQFNAAGPFSTGNAGVDFLLGIPDSYNQGSGELEIDRAQEYYSYVQDSFKIRSNVTLIYGLGWTIDTPMIDIGYDRHAQLTFRAGQQSTVFPNAPLGILYEGDQNAEPAGTTHFSDFGPRLGIAYSPGSAWPSWLTGGPDKTSIRAGFGIYYDRSETEQSDQVSAATPPFAIASEGYGSVGSPAFDNPFTSLTNPTNTVTNPFPFPGAPSSVNFATTPGFEPVWGPCCARVDQDTKDPMVQNWNFTIERQLDSSSILTLSYVGSSAHHLSVALPLNIATNITPCLLDPSCGVFTQTAASGAGAHPTDFTYPANVYGTIDTIYSIGRSNYNAFEASVNRKLSHGLQLTASYTYAHAIDNGSGFENSGFAGSFGGFGGFGEARASNPYCWPGCDVASSTFDARHRFVFSYFYEIPGMRGNWAISRLTRGWTIAGITTFQTGFPLDVTYTADPSLGCQPAQSDFVCWDGPDLVGKVQYLNPRTTGSWFSGSAFAPPPAYATPASASVVTLPLNFGNAPRNLMRGPGRNNWDFQLYKDTQINERLKFELRMEAYNVFNHTQFDPNGIITDLNFGPAFGAETLNYSPRLMQLAAKFYF
jgi:hypothetical protein